MDQKYINQNKLKMWPFEPAKESLCFLRGPLEWLMVVKNVKIIYVFDWRSLQSVAMLTTKFLLDDKITASVKQICLLGVICKVWDRKTLTNEKFCYQYFTINTVVLTTSAPTLDMTFILKQVF